MKMIPALIVLTFAAATLCGHSAKALTQQRHAQLSFSFDFKDPKKSFEIKDDVVLDNDSSWAPLGPSIQGVALLGKYRELNDGIVRLSYMVIDTSTQPTRVQEMSLITKIDQDASMTSGSPGIDAISVKSKLIQK